MRWSLSHSADPGARLIADRHYNRQRPGSMRFVPPGRCITLLASPALWVSSWPFPEYVRHEWAGAWVNTLFRNEGAGLSSELILEAIAATRFYWPEPPDLGIVTFINRDKVRHKRDYGRCYRRAGFEVAGETKGGLLTLQLLPADMPEAEAPLGADLKLWEGRLQ